MNEQQSKQPRVAKLEVGSSLLGKKCFSIRDVLKIISNLCWMLQEEEEEAGVDRDN